MVVPFEAHRPQLYGDAHQPEPLNPRLIRAESAPIEETNNEANTIFKTGIP